MAWEPNFKLLLSDSDGASKKRTEGKANDFYLTCLFPSNDSIPLAVRKGI